MVAIEFIVREPRHLASLGQWAADRRRSSLDMRRPWWPYDAISAVSSALPAGADVFEFGCGGSTLWLLDLGHKVRSIEHVGTWRNAVAAKAPGATVDIIEPADVGTIASDTDSGYFDHYVGTVEEEADRSLDLVIVDGRVRVECGLAAMSKVRPGAMLLLDDSHRKKYFPLVDRLGGWGRVDYRGFKPGGGLPAQTTIWRRPLASS